MMVVDDMESIQPKNKLLTEVKPMMRPAQKPVAIMPMTMTKAVVTAEPPVFANFLKLKVNPNEKRRKMIPSSAQKSMLVSSTTVGNYPKCGPTRKPANM